MIDLLEIAKAHTELAQVSYQKGLKEGRMQILAKLKETHDLYCEMCEDGKIYKHGDASNGQWMWCPFTEVR